MKTIKIFNVLFLLATISFSAGGCLKIQSKSIAEKTNEELEGIWELKEFKLNGNPWPISEGAITTTFIQSETFPQEGKMITKQESQDDQVAFYKVSEDGKTIRVDGEDHEISVGDTDLIIWQTSKDEFDRNLVIETVLKRI